MTNSLRRNFALGLLSSIAAMLFLVLMTSEPAHAIPAFARKYGLPCSACHEAWPKLNSFGITFKDNGYQLGNERDSPIYQNPAYWPVTFRITPNWQRETTNRVAVDSVVGSATSPTTEMSASQNGFNLGGLDILTGGTLYKNISFLLTPSSDENASFHFESAWVRLDNLFGSRWLNLKFGKHELDMPEALSEKRIMALSADGGFYQNYHYLPAGDTNDFGYGDNQIGLEISGHSRNSYTRYAVDVMSSTDGNVDLTNGNGLPNGNLYDVYAHVSHAVQVPKLGVQRFGALVYDGRRTTWAQTLGGTQFVGGTGGGSANFVRAGAYATLYFGKLDYTGMWMYGRDNVYLATGTPSYLGAAGLPAGATSPRWNGVINEVHYTVSPQFIVVGRYEVVRMSQQTYPVGTPVGTTGLTSTPSLGNTDAWTFGYRWYPIMFSRAGFAFHNEYSHTKMVGMSPVTGSDLNTSSIFVGFDFDF